MENESWADYLRIYPDDKDKDDKNKGPDPKTKIHALPLQFANVERLRKHDAVYIFDEVGAGKTVMAGLMALSRLRGNPDRGVGSNGKVLVITTNAVVKNKQFENTWLNTLHFADAGLEINSVAEDVSIINNYWSNVWEVQNKGEIWELIIVDEAHLFLNPSSDMSEYLTQLRAKKVALMTATPIRNNARRDIRRYVEIAETMLDVDGRREKLIDAKTNELIDILENRESLICGAFDLKSPVTRYFKSTILGLSNAPTADNTTRVRRQPARVCYYYSDKNQKTDKSDGRAYSKEEAVLNYLRGNWSAENQPAEDQPAEAEGKSPEDRFIIFVRRKEDEAWPLKEYLNENGFVDFDSTVKRQPEDTVAVSTGDTKDLWKYSGVQENFPRVLIMTYQLAEQGVDLPGFNHVLNYYIPPSPARLEQRYGRVDRLSGSSYNKIYMAYFIGGDEGALYSDLNTLNYARSLSVFFRHVLACVPSRSVLISEEMLDLLSDQGPKIRDRVKTLAKELKKLESEQNTNDLINKLPQELQDIARKLVKSISDYDRTDDPISVSKYIEEVDRVSRNLGILRENLFGAFRLKIHSDANDPSQISDSIFYYDANTALSDLGDSTDPVDPVQWIKDLSAEDIAKNLHCVSPEECISDIQNNWDYRQYAVYPGNQFERFLRIPVFFRDHAIELDEKLENRFIHNKLLTGDQDLLQRDVELFRFLLPIRKDEYREDPADRARNLMSRRPLFRMFDILKDILEEKLYGSLADRINNYVSKKSDYTRYVRNPIPDVLAALRKKLREDDNRQWFTDDFFERVFKRIPENAGAEEYNRLFWIHDDATYRICASPWYRLVYYTMLRCEREEKRKNGEFRYCGYQYRDIYRSKKFEAMLFTDNGKNKFRSVFAPPCPLTDMSEDILERVKKFDFNDFADELTISICATVRKGYDHKRRT